MMHSAKTVLFQPAASQPYEKVFIKTDNVVLCCKVMGKGNPFIAVHGGPGLSMDYLLPGLEELAKDHLLIFYDQRGNGESTGEINDENMNIEKFVEDLEAIQNHFNLAKSGFVGHSWGTYLAMQYAISHPDRVNKLILLNSIPISFSEQPSSSEEKQDPYEAMIDKIIKSDAFRDNNAEGMINHYKEYFQFCFYDAKLVDKLNLEKMSANQVKNSARIHKEFERNFFHKSHDLSEQLKKLDSIRIPTLIIHGAEHDIPIAVAKEINSLIKNSTLTILDSGHFPHVEKPKELFSAITQFNQAHPIKNEMVLSATVLKQ